MKYLSSSITDKLNQKSPNAAIAVEAAVAALFDGEIGVDGFYSRLVKAVGTRERA